ncbi:hypothetical protein [Bradyrhizobium paxllaeri]|uniref:hypothetical protein n=1 Tax=Bradyrhizobium paxllaeri TaxID=190148 RepID=UPI001146202D|nr:hypothetical protein [Bradyrhizobium paxllaeri]
MNDAVAWTQPPRNVGASDKPDLADISKPVRHEPEFDGVDWSAAAPGWLSLFIGLFLPLLALALLVVSIDLALVWLFERWIDPSSNMSPLLLATIMFPPALMSVFCGFKLFLHFRDARTATAQSRKQ